MILFIIGLGADSLAKRVRRKLKIYSKLGEGAVFLILKNPNSKTNKE